MTAANICSNFGGFRCSPPLFVTNFVTGDVIGMNNNDTLLGTGMNLILAA